MVSPNTAQVGLPLPLHAGAEEYFKALVTPP